MSIATLAAAIAGAIVGILADRLSARWPAHAATSPPRGLGWRTVVLALIGAAAFGALQQQFTEPRDVAVLAIYFAALVILAATDLDQKLLPDLITLPLIGFALVAVILGWDPLLADKQLGLISGIVMGIVAPLFLIVTDRLLGGGLGFGDVKLAVGLGLMSGVTRLVGGFLIASVGFSVVLVLLIAFRRIGLKSAIPFGPVLICAGFIGAFLS